MHIGQIYIAHNFPLTTLQSICIQLHIEHLHQHRHDNRSRWYRISRTFSKPGYYLCIIYKQNMHKLHWYSKIWQHFFPLFIQHMQFQTQYTVQSINTHSITIARWKNYMSKTYAKVCACAHPEFVSQDGGV